MKKSKEAIISFIWGWLGTIVLLLCIGCLWQGFSPDAPWLYLIGIGIWCGIPIGIICSLVVLNN